MTTAMSIDGTSQAAAATPAGDSSVALQDQLARCTQKLGDWVACESSKTPEGKKIIADLRAQIGHIESRLGTNAAPAANAAPTATKAPLSTLGSLVNTHV